MTIAEEGKINLWDGDELLDSLDIYDEDLKGKLGTEDLKLTPKTFCFRDGVMVIGFEQNIIIKFNLDTNTREVLIAGPSFSPQ